MDAYPLFIHVLAGLALLIFTLLSAVVIRHHLNRSALLMLASAVLFTWVLYTFNVIYARNDYPDTFMEWFIHLDVEGNLPNGFSSLMLLSAAIVSIIVLLLKRPIQSDHLFWLASSLLMVMMTYDEWFSPAIHHSSSWKLLLLVAGLGLGATIAFAAWHQREQWFRYALIVCALGLIAFSGFVLDSDLFGEVPTAPIEETLELIGLALFLSTLMTLAADGLTTLQWRIAGGLPLLVGVIISGQAAFEMLLQDPLAARSQGAYMEAPVVFGDAMTVEGYHVVPESPQPGEDVEVTFYWRVNRPLSRNYHYSLHLLALPQMTSVAQVDSVEMGKRPTKLWHSGLLMSHTAQVTVEEDAPVPAAYALALRIWTGDVSLQAEWDDWQAQTESLPVTDARWRLSEDTVLLHGGTLLAAAQEPPDTPAIHFGNGITLSVVTENPASPVFYWQATHDIQSELVQIVHLLDDAGERIVLDRVPFDGAVPTPYWQAGFAAEDAFALPPDIALERYQLVTGLYIAETGERVPVTDAGTYTVQDNMISLPLSEDQMASR